MGTRTETVETYFTWNTTDAEKGAKRLHDIIDKTQRAEEKLTKPNKGGGHGGSGNLVAMVKDFAEGRTMFGLARMGEKLGAIGAIGLVAAHKVSELQEAIRATTDELSRYSEEARKADRESRGLNIGSGSGSALSGISSARDRQRQGENTMFETEKATSVWHNPATAVAYGMQKLGDKVLAGLGKVLSFGDGGSGGLNGTGYLKQFGTYHPIEDAKKGAEQGKELAGGNENKALDLYRKIKDEELETQFHRLKGEDLMVARAEERLELARRIAEITNTLGEKDPSIEVERQIYDMRIKVIDREQDMRNARNEGAKEELRIAGSNASPYMKRKEAIESELGTARELKKILGQKDTEQARMLDRRISSLQNDNRLNEIKRNLNDDGTKKPAGELHRQDREDKREERLKNRFITTRAQRSARDQHKSDPSMGTPTRGGGGDMPDEGIRTGSLKSGHVQGADAPVAGRGLRPAGLWQTMFNKSAGMETFTVGDKKVRGTMGFERETEAGGHSTDDFRKQFAPRNQRTLDTLEQNRPGSTLDRSFKDAIGPKREEGGEAGQKSAQLGEKILTKMQAIIDCLPSQAA